MSNVEHHPNGLLIVSDLRKRGLDDRALRRSDQVKRIRRGVYVPADRASAQRDARYDLRVAAVLATRRRDVVVSHYSAARLWGLPIVNDWPYEVHITDAPGSSRRSKNGVVVHRAPLQRLDLVDVAGEFRATSIARTLVDLASNAPMRDSVTAIDHALHHDLAVKDQLLALLDERGQVNGRRLARAAIEFSTALSDSPGESYSRVLMHELGFPAPVLQKEFVTRPGSKRRTDFWWEDVRAAGEFDGNGKYLDPDIVDGRSPEEVLLDQRKRERELRLLDVRFARWDWKDLNDMYPFIEQLEAVGLKRIRKPAFVPVPARGAPRAGRNVPEWAQ